MIPKLRQNTDQGCFKHLMQHLYSLKIFSQEIFELPLSGLNSMEKSKDDSQKWQGYGQREVDDSMGGP